MANLLCIRGTLRRESPKHSRWKIPNCNLAKISDINWIPVTSKPTKHSGKSSGVFAAKDLLLQGRRQRGASGAATPIWNWCPSFQVWPPGCYIHPILYFKNVAPPSGFWPLLLVFGPPCCYILATILSYCWSIGVREGIVLGGRKKFALEINNLPWK